MMIRNEFFATGVRFFLGVGAMIAATTFEIGSAHAGVTQVKDTFDSGWSSYVSGSGGVVGHATSNIARSPNRVGLMVWPGGGSTSDWAMMAKAFFWTSTDDGGHHPVFTACAARVFVRRHPSFAAAISGQLEMINTITNTYVGVQTFSLPANNSSWVGVTVGNTWSCSPWLSVRVVVPNNAQSRAVLLDDMTLQWFF